MRNTYRVLLAASFALHGDSLELARRSTALPYMGLSAELAQIRKGSPQQARALVGFGDLRESDQSVLSQLEWNETDAEAQGRRIKLFCFAWTPRRERDNLLMQSVRRQLEACDGHAFYTDNWTYGNESVFDAEDVVRVQVPPQDRARDSKQWLFHKNMAGLLPAWSHILRNKIHETYDWVINVELDHFVRPSKVRTTIAAYVQMLRHGTGLERQKAQGPLMLSFGNAFVFNRELTQAMRDGWNVVGMTKPDGCPKHAARCEQDMTYMEILQKLNTSIGFAGQKGCGTFAETQKHRLLPLACWDLSQNPIGSRARKLGKSQELGVQALRIVAQQPAFMTPRRAAGLTVNEWKPTHKDIVRNLWEWEDSAPKLFYFAPRNVPIIHHMDLKELHDFAHELLGV